MLPKTIIMDNQDDIRNLADGATNLDNTIVANQNDNDVANVPANPDATSPEQLVLNPTEATVHASVEQTAENDIQNTDNISDKTSYTSAVNRPISDRELRNLQSANVPGLQELFGIQTTRRSRVNFPQLKHRFKDDLDRALDRASQFPKYREDPLLPGSEPGFKSAFNSFKEAVGVTSRCGNQFRERLIQDGATSEASSVATKVNKLLGWIHDSGTNMRISSAPLLLGLLED